MYWTKVKTFSQSLFSPTLFVAMLLLILIICVAMLLLILIICVFHHSYCSPSICTAVKHAGNATHVSFPDSPFIYDFIFNITFNPTNSSFPNQIAATLSNLSPITTNFALINPSYFYFGDSGDKFNEWSFPPNVTYITTFPNGKMQFVLHNFVQFLYDYLNVTDGIELFFYNGAVYDSKNGMFFDEENNLISYESSFIETELWHLHQEASCTRFKTVVLPSIEKNFICTIFNGRAVITDPKENMNIEFDVNYVLTSEDKNSAHVDIEFFMLNAPDIDYQYILRFNDDIFISGSNYDTTNSSSSFELIYDVNKQIEIIFTFKSSNILYDNVNIGELIICNENYYKNINQPYTSNDSCWHKHSDIPFSNAAVLNATFCCTSFKDDGNFHLSTTKSPSDATTSIGTKSTDNYSRTAEPTSRETTTAKESSSSSIDVKTAIYCSLMFLIAKLLFLCK